VGVENDSTPESELASDFDDEEIPAPWDTQERATMLRRVCHLPRVFRRRKIHHSFHFMLALGTLGLWLPVWGILIILQLLKPWTCTVCSVHQRN
jgi:hypothetical protein